MSIFYKKMVIMHELVHNDNIFKKLTIFDTSSIVLLEDFYLTIFFPIY